MNDIALESIIIFVLLIANGIFSMAEMALVSSRKARLRSLAEKGERGAEVALELAESPNHFLSTVQFGITLIGILAGVFGGATLADDIAVYLRPIPFIGHYAGHVSLGLVVIVITYLSLIIGELVPKRVALRNPEQISAFMSRPMQALSRLAGPAVHFLSFSTETILRLFGVKDTKEAAVTEEEVAGMVQEGLEAGVIQPTESEMVHSVLALDRLHVNEIMTPRPRIVWISADDSHDQIWHKIVVSHHSHFPVFEERRDHVLGFLSVKRAYANLAAGLPIKVRDLISPALIVPEIQSSIDLLETFKKDGRHVALATDEYGGISGIVTMNDIIEAIVGEIPEIGRATNAFVKRDDGSILVDALVGIEEVESYFPAFSLSKEEERKYSTLGGFVCQRLGHIPVEGENFEDQGFRFEVIDMDRQRVDKVLVTELPSIVPMV